MTNDRGSSLFERTVLAPEAYNARLLWRVRKGRRRAEGRIREAAEGSELCFVVVGEASEERLTQSAVYPGDE